MVFFPCLTVVLGSLTSNDGGPFSTATVRGRLLNRSFYVFLTIVVFRLCRFG